MKLSYSRRYRRSASRSRENKMFNKDHQHEHTFFSAPSHDSFFKPNAAIQRKCEHCAAEDKKVSKMTDSKEEDKSVHKMEEKKEEKPVMKMEEKKEEKPVMKMEEKKEDDKSVHKMEEKKEEKPIMKMEEKKEEKEVSKMEEKKEEKEAPKMEEKQLSKMEEKKEEKPVMKMEDKKEEKEVHKLEEKKEEDKSVQKMEEKKEEKPVMKMDEKKEEKEVHKMEEKKEEKEVQKMEDKKEEKEVQKMDEKKEEKKVAMKVNGATPAAAQSSAYIHSLDGKGNPLPDNTKQFFNQRLGHDFSAVKIHTGTEAEQSAKDLNAKAYAVDHNIVFNKGQYNPGTAEGNKLLAHELVHIIQNKKAKKINRKEQHPDKEKEKTINVTGKSTTTKKKVAHGNCEGVEVHGQTDANYTNRFTTTVNAHPSEVCEECTPPDCITARGTIVSTFAAHPVVTLPPVPSGLTPCETKAVAKFINTTLRNHEQRHVAAFNTYTGVVRTPYEYTGCQSGLEGYLQSIHDNIESQRAAAANASSDALDPFTRPIPCNCE